MLYNPVIGCEEINLCMFNKTSFNLQVVTLNKHSPTTCRKCEKNNLCTLNITNVNLHVVPWTNTRRKYVRNVRKIIRAC